MLTCHRDDCDWTHEAVSPESDIDALEHHILTDCPRQAAPERHTDNAGGPADPLGTVRTGPGVLAVRAHSANPDTDEPVWFIIDIGDDSQTLNTDTVEAHLGTWPIVYQPTHSGIDHQRPDW